MSAVPCEPLAYAEADSPPEVRGLARDAVRMLVVRPDQLAHRRVHDLPTALAPGDLLVVNTSATLPAAVPLTDGTKRLLHVSSELDDGDWVVELRRPGGTGPAVPAVGETLRLPGLDLGVRAPYPLDQTRLWRATPRVAVDRVTYLWEHGRPISYSYVRGTWPLDALQNVYADAPGSAEMPSAGRPLSAQVLVRLMARGVVVVPLVLHTGVSSQEAHEPPQPEPYVVPEPTARLVNLTRRAGGRVVGVGTTVARALETVADRHGEVRAGGGWTSLVLGPDRPARVVDGLLTGLHAPEASHLDLLRAVAGNPLVNRAYREVEQGPRRYLWHEFGDTMLFLP
jgi:S-adenosylmethionine:tRNA ribosyltransferase-isomerase